MNKKYPTPYMEENEKLKADKSKDATQSSPLKGQEGPNGAQ